VEISGLEVHVAKHLFFVRGVFGVDVDTDLDLQVRGPLGQLPTSSPFAPWLRWHHLMRIGDTSSWGSPSSLDTCWRCGVEAWSSGTLSISSRATFGSWGRPLLALASLTFSTSLGKRTDEFEPLGTTL
jgi:hypothetical protein